MCILGLFVMAVVYSLVAGHAFLSGLKVGMIARIIATSAIYQKVCCGIIQDTSHSKTFFFPFS